VSQTMERRPEIGLDSYDRFFPSQDTLPKGGFGNLIALPLQKKPREHGNSVFLDETLIPYFDQMTERREHVDVLANLLAPHISNVFVMRGGMGKRQRQKLVEQIASVPSDEPQVIVATGRYLGEGFDNDELDTLFMALPISWRGTLTQYAGRLHRLNESKKEVIIYDYVDVNVPVLVKMHARRRTGYKAIGYEIASEDAKSAQLPLQNL
jgi:superfamily II DNA or RNA helicase